MEYDDDIEKKDQDKEVKAIASSIKDPEDVQDNMKTKAQLAKMDYQKFVEDEFGKIEEEKQVQANTEQKEKKHP